MESYNFSMRKALAFFIAVIMLVGTVITPVSASTYAAGEPPSNSGADYDGKNSLDIEVNGESDDFFSDDSEEAATDEAADIDTEADVDSDADEDADVDEDTDADADVDEDTDADADVDADEEDADDEEEEIEPLMIEMFNAADVSVGTEQALRNAISAAGTTRTYIEVLNGFTIPINPGPIIIPSGADIVLFSNAGVVLQCFAAAGIVTPRHFIVENGGSLTLDYGITLSRTLGGNSGGVEVNGGTLIILEGAVLTDNRGSQNGGAVHLIGGNLILDGGRIFENTAEYGGAIRAIDGAVITIRSGDISNNEARFRGGGIHMENGRIEMTGGVISGNGTTQAPPEEAEAQTFSAAFMPLNALSGPDYHPHGRGGGVYAADSVFNISGATISNNRSAGHGGGVMALNSTFSMTTGTIVANSAAGASAGGGLAFIGGTAVINNSAIGEVGANGNTASSGGGIYVLSGNLTLTDSTISGNVSAGSGNGGGGLELRGAATVVMNGGTISHNEANQGGGVSIAIASQGDDVSRFTINGGTISQNRANMGGGAVIVNNHGIYVSVNTNVLNNAARTGGGLSLDAAGEATITGGAVSGNTATAHGAGVSNSGRVEIIGAVVENNRATQSGGGVVANGTTTIRNSVIRNNTAGEMGGGVINGIHLTNASPTAIVVGSGDLRILDASVVSGNTAGIYGGGVYIRDLVTTLVPPTLMPRYLEISDSTVSGNMAGRHGGGIYIETVSDAHGTLRVLGASQMSGNIAGAEIAGGVGTGALDDSASGEGGAIFTAAHSSRITINTSVQFANNKASGGYWIEDYVDDGIYNPGAIITASELRALHNGVTLPAVGTGTLSDSGTGRAFTHIANNFDVNYVGLDEDLRIYTVTFEYNRGINEAPYAVVSEVLLNTPLDSRMPAVPAWAGYEFIRWDTQANGGGTEFTDATVVTGNITVYAQWGIETIVMPSDFIKEAGSERYTPGESLSYTISFRLPDNIDNYASITITDEYDSSKVSTPTLAAMTINEVPVNPLPATVIDGNGRPGWTLQRSQLNAGDVIKLQVVVGVLETTSDTIVNTAILRVTDLENNTRDEETEETIDARKYTVTFMYNRGINEAPYSVVSDVIVNTSLGARMPAVPAWSGYEFIRWDTQANGGGTEFTDATVVTGNITVYAQWEIETVVMPRDFIKEANTEAYTPGANLSYTISFRLPDNIDNYASITIIDDYDSSKVSTPILTSLTINDVPIGQLPTMTTDENGRPGWTLQRSQLNAGDVIKLVVVVGVLETTSDTIVNTAILRVTDLENNTRDEETEETIDARKYTVTFMYNRGIDEAPHAIVSDVIVNTSLGARMPAVPAWSGYEFIRWDTQANGSGTAFTNNTPVVGNITVYAQWEIETIVMPRDFIKEAGLERYTPGENLSYTISFRLPDNIDNYASITIIDEYDSSKVSTPTLAMMTINEAPVNPLPDMATDESGRPGWTLQRSQLNAGDVIRLVVVVGVLETTSDTIVNTAILRVTDLENNTRDEETEETIDAQKYTVTFMYNRGIDEAPHAIVSDVIVNTSLGARMPAVPVWLGYDFIRWDTQANGSGTVFTNNTPVVGNITVYAQWEIETIVMPRDFIKEAGLERYTPGENLSYTISFRLPDNIDNYASITIIDEYDSSKVSTPTLAMMTINEVPVNPLPDMVTDESGRPGWTLQRSQLNAGDVIKLEVVVVVLETAEDTIVNTAILRVTDLDNNTRDEKTEETIDARKYTVTFLYNRGTDEAPYSVVSDVIVNTSLGVRMPEVPVWLGYDFIRWDTQANGSGAVFANSTPVVGNITVYAQWVINEIEMPTDFVKSAGADAYVPGGTLSYTISFRLPSNIDNYASVTIIDRYDSSKVSTPLLTGLRINEIAVDSLPAMVLTDGHPSWTIPRAQLTAGVVLEFVVEVTVHANATGVIRNVAVMRVTDLDGGTKDDDTDESVNIRTHTVTFDRNRGQDDDTVSVGNVPHGRSLGDGMPENPTRAGWTFTGWNTARDGSGDAFTRDTIVTGSVTVYAQWSRNASPPSSGPPPAPRIIEDELPPLEVFINDHYAYIIGYPGGEVRPGNNITRAEVATVFFRLLTDNMRQEHWSQINGFTDVLSPMWHNNAISVMSNMGIVNGYPDGSYAPNGTITRAELAAIAARFAPMMGMYSNGAAGFVDVAGHWAEEHIIAAAGYGWVTGYEDGTFRPNQPITRAEFITIVNRMLERVLRSPEDLLEDEMIAWIDNLNQSAWFYLAVQEATHSTIPGYREEVVPGQQFEYKYWDQILPNPDWVELEREWSTANSVRMP